jgi:outer membrane biogenesis lipoprotein LolB
VLRQDGWEIVYTYADDTATLPRRLTLAYPGVDMRVVVDRWQ